VSESVQYVSCFSLEFSCETAKKFYICTEFAYLCIVALSK